MLTVSGTIVNRTRRPINYHRAGQSVTGSKVTYTVVSSGDESKIYHVTDFDPTNDQLYPRNEKVQLPVEVNFFNTKRGASYELRIARTSFEEEAF